MTPISQNFLLFRVMLPPCWRTDGQTWRSSWSLVVNLPWRRPQTKTHTKMNITPVAAQTKDVSSARVFSLALRLWLCIKQSDIFFPLLETQRPLCPVPQEHNCHGTSWRMRDSCGLKAAAFRNTVPVLCTISRYSFWILTLKQHVGIRHVANTGSLCVQCWPYRALKWHRNVDWLWIINKQNLKKQSYFVFRFQVPCGLNSKVSQG